MEMERKEKRNRKGKICPLEKITFLNWSKVAPYCGDSLQVAFDFVLYVTLCQKVCFAQLFVRVRLHWTKRFNSWVPQDVLKDNKRVPPWSNSHRQLYQRQGKWGGILLRLQQCPSQPPLTSILLANVQSLDNKLDKLQCQIGHEGLLCTRLDGDLAEPIKLIWWSHTTGWFLCVPHRTFHNDYRQAQESDVCSFINNSWHTDMEKVSQFCLAELEQLTKRCRPFYLPS